MHLNYTITFPLELFDFLHVKLLHRIESTSVGYQLGKNNYIVATTNAPRR